MKRLFSYLVLLLTFVGAILIILQSAYIVGLRLGLFPFISRSLNLESLSIRKANVAFIQNMIALLLIICVIEISLFWLLVIFSRFSKLQGLVATLILIILVGLVVLFAFIASIV